MARNGSGTFSYVATSVAPAVGGTTIDSDDFNTTMTEIADALTQSLSKDGQTVITGAMDFDGKELILDVDGDTSITSDTDDQIDFRVGGTDRFSMSLSSGAPKFDIQCGTNDGDLFFSATNTTSIQTINFKDSAGSATGKIFYEHSTDNMWFTTAATSAMVITSGNNVKIGNSFTMGTSAAKVLGIDIGTEPSTSPAGMIQMYAKDSSDGTTNATLGLRTEQAVEAIGTFTPSHKLKIWINAVEYWIQLDAV